jgi:hypothetical protein
MLSIVLDNDLPYEPRLRAVLSMRTDFFGDVQKDEQLYAAHRLVSVGRGRLARLLCR